ncbi:MAG: IS21 family transposase [Microlunatus sp.]|nr:IS21 family transposase [Microlunatus sp.]
MITMEDWALIRRLAAEGTPNAAIARRLGISRTTVIKAVRSDAPPKYERTAAESSFVVFEPRVRVLLKENPDLPASVLAERVGWQGSESWFRQNVAQLRPEHRPVDPADRIIWEAGDAAQCDLWFPPKKIPLENGTTSLLPVLVMTLAYSRFMLARMIPTRTTEDLLLGMWQLLPLLGRVPRRLIWDNERGIGRGRQRSQGVPAFTGTLATRLVLLKPRDPESKGVVERRNGWFETSFMPSREFASPADFNTQLGQWLEISNSRVVRTIKARPTDRLEADKSAMLALPPLPPVVGWSNQVRLGRDYYVRVASNDYSVDPTWISRMVDVHADLERVQVRHDGKLISEHPRVWARGLTVTDPAHVTTARRLRQQFQQPTSPAAADGLVRDLADYDTAFGLSGEGIV